MARFAALPAPRPTLRLARRSRTGLALALLLGLAIAASQHLWLFERSWFELRQWYGADALEQDSLRLHAYQVSIEARGLEGLTDLSGLTFDPDRGTLFGITNARPEVLELSRDGDLLRRIALHGFDDPEAIEYLAPGRFVITDEREQRLLEVRIDADTTRLDAADAPQLGLGLGLNGNKGFEGLAYDASGQRLFVAKERDPMQILEVTGFPQHTPGARPNIQLRTDLARDDRLFVTDLSSLAFDPRRKHLLVLSDESRLLLELDDHGHPLSSLSLREGRHGLSASVPQPEGVALDEDGTLYLVSEPNLFYRFDKQAE